MAVLSRLCSHDYALHSGCGSPHRRGTTTRPPRLLSGSGFIANTVRVAPRFGTVLEHGSGTRACFGRTRRPIPHGRRHTGLQLPLNLVRSRPAGSLQRDRPSIASYCVVPDTFPWRNSSAFRRRSQSRAPPARPSQVGGPLRGQPSQWGMGCAGCAHQQLRVARSLLERQKIATRPPAPPARVRDKAKPPPSAGTRRPRLVTRTILELNGNGHPPGRTDLVGPFRPHCIEESAR